jgi:hypothetical protein
VETLENRSVPSATTFVFHLDPAHSHLSVSGTITAGKLGPFQLKPQQVGSLRASISGSIQASVDLATHKIRFMAAGTSLVAVDDFNASPGANGAAGKAPAALAAFVAGSKPAPFRVDLAFRDGVGTLSTARALTLSSASNPTFPSTETVGLRSTAIDFRPSGAATGLLSPGRVSLAGKFSGNHAAAPGQLQSLGNDAFRIVVPIRALVETVSHGTTTILTFDGTLTGTARVAPVITAPTATQHVPRDKTLVFSMTDHNVVCVADQAGGSQTVTLTASHGVLKLSELAGLTVHGNGTGQVTACGSVARINAALDGLTFTPERGFQGNAALEVTARDGHDGSAADTVKVVVTSAAMPARKLHGGHLVVSSGTIPLDDSAT